MRNKRLNAPQDETTDPKPGGHGSDRTAHPPSPLARRGTPGLGDVAGREATVKVCGVVVAMVQGHSWVPIPSKGSRVNVGTVLVFPDRRRRQRRIGTGERMAG